MHKEHNALLHNSTYTLVPLPADHKAVGTRWIFKIKHHADGSIECFKARWVAKGYTQQQGIDYDETFAPVVHLENLRLLLALATLLNLEVNQIDVDSAFLQADVDEQVYISQPEGFESTQHPDYICLLQKSLYRLKQAPLLWNRTFDMHMCTIGFTPLEADLCIYILKTVHSQPLTIVSVYIDDCLIIGLRMNVDRIKQQLAGKILIKDLRPASSILSVEVLHDCHTHTLQLHQQGHIKGILKKFGMHDSKPVATLMMHGLVLSKINRTPVSCCTLPYCQAVSSLLYLALASCPDIAFAVNVLSCHVDMHNETHWMAVKHVLHYLNGT
jgi:hypothetical protein